MKPGFFAITNLVRLYAERIDVGTGTCRSYFTVLQSTPELPLQPIIAGRYQDRFERSNGTWRFAVRHIITDYVGDVSRQLVRPLS